jgi:hypothetical protein
LAILLQIERMLRVQEIDAEIEQTGDDQATGNNQNILRKWRSNSIQSLNSYSGFNAFLPFCFKIFLLLFAAQFGAQIPVDDVDVRLREKMAELASVEQIFVEGAAQVAIGSRVTLEVFGSTSAFAIDWVTVELTSKPGVHGCK